MNDVPALQSVVSFNSHNIKSLEIPPAILIHAEHLDVAGNHQQHLPSYRYPNSCLLALCRIGPEITTWRERGRAVIVLRERGGRHHLQKAITVV